MKCLVPGCENVFQKDCGFTFHRIPKKPEQRTRWIQAMGLPVWKDIPKDARVCSKHFTENSVYQYESYGKAKLRRDAIPSIFPNDDVVISGVIRDTQQNGVDDKCQACLSQRTCFRDASTQSGKDMVKDLASRKQLTRQLQNLRILHQKAMLKIHNLSRKVKRKNQKITTMKNILNDIRRQNFLAEEKLQSLTNLSITTKQICNRQMKKTGQYSPELRQFALTLHFYSPKAYNYVRSKFNTCLPHPTTIAAWYSTVNGNPGFTVEAFKAIKSKQENTSYQIVGNLVYDEVSIRSQLEYVGSKFYGYEDFGSEFTDERSELAKEALVYLLTAVNMNWKIPIGYFLCKSVNASQKKALLIKCLTLLHDTKILVKSVTFDGHKTNISMMDILGCPSDKLAVDESPKTYFSHPITNEKVFLFLDPCHVIKMIRNAFAFKKNFIDKSGNTISWTYLEKLVDLQESQNFYIANKLGKLHTSFKNQIMKVKLATQVFSNSVADALSFCDNMLKLDQFKDVGATVQFIRYLNNFFDVFNSKNNKAMNFKQALNEFNKANVFNFLTCLEEYIKTLRVKDSNTLLLYSDRKTGFKGILLNIFSLKRIFVELHFKKILQYLPTYKLSQDHIELLFYSLRSSLGDNNNPTCRQLVTAYRKLLIHMEVKEGRTGNCIPLENISILHVSSKVSNSVSIINNSTASVNIVDFPVEQKAQEHDYDIDETIILNEITEKVVAYIGGYVVRYLLKIITCDTCRLALITDADVSDPIYMLIKHKQRGGLYYPSKDVIDVCRRSEEVLGFYLKLSGNKRLSKCYTVDVLTKQVLKSFLGVNIFENIYHYMFEQQLGENHIIHLIRAIGDKYLRIRINYLCKRQLDKSLSLRKVYNKLILNSGL